VAERQKTTEAVRSFNPEALRRLRQAAGLSHDALAALVAINRQGLIAYEKGTKRVGLHSLHLLARALDVDPLELTTVTRSSATLADLRARAGVSKTDLAARLGMHRTMWDRVERGERRLSRDNTQAVAEVLGVEASEVRAALERGVRARPDGGARP
jgi:transcriptional regulator with XRE-family HTH domain